VANETAALEAARGAAAQSGPQPLVLFGTRGGRASRLHPEPGANLIVWNNVPYVIDTGYGVSFKLVEGETSVAGDALYSSRTITSDHNAEFGLLGLQCLGNGVAGRRSMPTVQAA